MPGFLDYVSGVTDWLTGEQTSEQTAGIASLLGAGAAMLSGSDFFKPEIPVVGYQGGIPEYTAVKERVQDTYDPSRRPGSGGQRYSSDTEFAGQGQEGAAKQRAIQQAMNLKAQNAANTARQTRQYGAPPPQVQPPMPIMGGAPASSNPIPQQGGLAGFPPQYNMGGGIAALAAGGAASSYNRRHNNQNRNGYYLGGPTDGMGDSIPATIDGTQEARLSDGEFVVPADVVSHLGNGNSNAGAENLYGMMDKVRQARTGNTQQGKQINPNKFIPSR
tara:strand:- start:1442 stop:2266 length:825 start_codon:yes stop_codon:yes gene_type:complete